MAHYLPHESEFPKLPPSILFYLLKQTRLPNISVLNSITSTILNYNAVSRYPFIIENPTITFRSQHYDFPSWIFAYTGEDISEFIARLFCYIVKQKFRFLSLEKAKEHVNELLAPNQNLSQLEQNIYFRHSATQPYPLKFDSSLRPVKELERDIEKLTGQQYMREWYNYFLTLSWHRFINEIFFMEHLRNYFHPTQFLTVRTNLLRISSRWFRKIMQRPEKLDVGVNWNDTMSACWRLFEIFPDPET